MILMQTKAIFIDAYRELNAKKLFWLTLGLNVIAVALFASIGINERGFTILFWTFDGLFNTSIMSRETFYKFEFVTWGVPIWLSWGTVILALVSTSGIIPDLVSGGTIEPILSKPIGRIRLFLTKYLTGLLFVAAQILVFSTGCFLVLGIRAGAWEFGLFLAIPIIIAYFSYLFSFCVLIGIVTRSTITALLLTIVFWLFVFVVHIADVSMVAERERTAIALENAPAMVESQERFAQKRIEQLIEQGKPIPGQNGEPLPSGKVDSLEAINPTLKTARQKLIDAQRSFDSRNTWASRVYTLKLILPKTQETIGLLERNLIASDELDGFINMLNGLEDGDDNPDNELGERIDAVYSARTTIWILGTSFIFEIILLGLSTIIFVRRDF